MPVRPATAPSALLRRPLGLALALAIAAPAAAQEAAPAPQPPAAADPADQAPEIKIIGTRIRGVDLSGATQAIAIDRKAIVESGATTVIDLLQQLPATTGGEGTFSTATAGALSSDTPVGASAVSLRGLGASSTLTLINSRRASVAAFARGQESFIDVSAIPVSAIERVEVLPNGASALYGADAVAGVINYVLRRDFEGLELTTSYGNSTASTDEGRLAVSGVAGIQTGDHQILVVADYFRRNPFFLRDRAASARAFRPSQQGFFPSFNDLFFMELDQTEGPGNGGCPPEEFGTGALGEYCEVNTNAFVSSQDRLESFSGMLTHRYRISDTVAWFTEVIGSTTKSRGVSSPANFSRTPIDPENPLFPQALKDDMAAEGGCRRFSCFFEFPIFMWGKYPDPRAIEVRSDSFRLVTGLEYAIGGSWQGETAFTLGGNDRVQRGLSGLVRTNLFFDLNLGNICTDGTRVTRWRTRQVPRNNATYVGNTCEAIGKTTLWYNPFGGQVEQAPGVRELIETTAERRGRSRMASLDTSASGDLFELPAGTVKAAIGAEWRNERLNDRPSGEAVADEVTPEPILGFSSTSARYERTQISAFAELYVPLATGLDLQLAGRFDNYDDFGSDFNPKVAARWQPRDWLILRGSWSTAFRAPSLAQSGAGPLLSSFRVSCRRTPEACGGNPAATGQSFFTEEIGNPDLAAETSRSLSFGGVLQPNRDFEFRADYWNIRHKDLVGIDEDDFIRRALAGEFPVFRRGELPSGVAGVEVENGFVVGANFPLQNLGFQLAEGMDFSATWYLPETPAGRFTLLADATWYFRFNRQASPASEVERLAGDFRYPRFIASTRLRWSKDRFASSIRMGYKSGYLDDPDPRVLDAVGLPRDAVVKVDDYLTFDWNLSYDITRDSFVSLNIRNLFDRKPPRVLGSSANVDLYNHDLIGRFVTARITWRF